MEARSLPASTWPSSINGTENNAKEIVLMMWLRGYDNHGWQNAHGQFASQKCDRRMEEAMRWSLLEGLQYPVLVPPLALSLPTRGEGGRLPD